MVSKTTARRVAALRRGFPGRAGFELGQHSPLPLPGQDLGNKQVCEGPRRPASATSVYRNGLVLGITRPLECMPSRQGRAPLSSRKTAVVVA